MIGIIQMALIVFLLYYRDFFYYLSFEFRQFLRNDVDYNRG